jgi:hypothetical protein
MLVLDQLEASITQLRQTSNRKVWLDEAMEHIKYLRKVAEKEKALDTPEAVDDFNLRLVKIMANVFAARGVMLSTAGIVAKLQEHLPPQVKNTFFPAMICMSAVFEVGEELFKAQPSVAEDWRVRMRTRAVEIMEEEIAMLRKQGEVTH